MRQLIADLKRAGFADRGGKGSRRNFIDGKGRRVTLSGKEGGDALPYQEREVKSKIEASQNEESTRDEQVPESRLPRNQKAPGGGLS